MRIIYKGIIYEVHNELTEKQFLNDGGKALETEEPKTETTNKKPRNRRKRTE